MEILDKLKTVNSGIKTIIIACACISIGIAIYNCTGTATACKKKPKPKPEIREPWEIPKKPISIEEKLKSTTNFAIE